jgi:hypothetical protein
MQRALAVLTIFAATHAASLPAADRCSTLRPDVGVAAAVTVGVFSDPRLPTAVVDRAVDAWSVCSSYAPDLPTLELGRSGTRDLFVEFDPEAIGSGERCGTFQGRTITIFALTRTRRGTIVSCGSLTRNLIHELGHALGLADAPTGCSSFAMAKLGPSNGVHRRVRAAECRALTARWVRLPEPPAAPWPSPNGALRVASSSAYP